MAVRHCAVMETPLLGILRLDTAFPRPPGDAGNPATWPFPVAIEVVPGADVERTTAGGAGLGELLAPFVAATETLLAEGVRAITTSCGFLALYQRDLARHCPVPVITSSLQQVAPVAAALPAGKRAGVITFDAERLTPAHLAAAGAPADTPVAGIEGGNELHRVILNDLGHLDDRQAEADILAAGEALRRLAPDLGAVVLECANMPPYAAALAHHLDLPVFDIVGLGTWLCRGIVPRTW